MPGPLFTLLAKRTGSSSAALSAMAEVAFRLGFSDAKPEGEELAGLALCARGMEIEKVSKVLDWRDFERLCSGVFRAKGYQVRQNILLRKPRAQVDIFAISDGISLAVDCKHWGRSAGYSGLARLVEAQKSRAKRLRESLDKIGPIAVVILVLIDTRARFVDGGAIVPVFALGDFLDNVDAFRDELEVV